VKDLAIVSSGMVTALGFNAPATLAALRGGISAVRQTQWVDYESGERLLAARVELPQWSERVEKLADLAAAAIDECVVTAGAERQNVPLLIGVASRQRPARPARLEEDLLEAIEARLDVTRHPESRLFPLDQTGCVVALATAAHLIGNGRARHVAVAGVDSFLHQPMMNAYIEKRRLMTPGNSNGFFPGEAGSAVLVAAAGTHDTDELRVLGFGAAREPAPIESTDAFRAQGLTQAVKQALDDAGVALKDVAYRLTDLSGEHYKFKEAAFVAGRLNGGEREVPLDLWHPIEYLGEIGAAILPCLLAQALHAGRERYAPGRLALCHVGSDEGDRAAMVVALHRKQRGAY
jgi:3-oxoacyl-[acyl-carrier-protein] synthase-1